MKRVQLENGKLGKAATWATNASKSTGNLARQMMGVSIASGAALFGIGKLGFAFEDSFSNVRKTVNATDAELEKFKEQVLDLSTTNPVSADALAGTMALGGQWRARIGHCVTDG